MDIPHRLGNTESSPGDVGATGGQGDDFVEIELAAFETVALEGVESGGVDGRRLAVVAEALPHWEDEGTGLFDQAVTEQSSLLPWGGRHIGQDGIVAFLGTLLSHLGPTLEIGRVFDAGDVVVQIGHTQGRVLAHGNQYRIPEVHALRLEAGKVASFRVWVDVPAMRAALSGE